MSSEILEPKDLRKGKLKKIVIIISAITLIATIAIAAVYSIPPSETPNGEIEDPLPPC